MGIVHARRLHAGEINHATLAAVADPHQPRCAPFSALACYRNAGEMIAAGGIDALLIATPHYQHTLDGIAGLKAGLHVLLEKPISVHVGDCARLLAAHTDRRQVFAAMFNQRTDPRYRKIRELLARPTFGPIQRVNWTVTNWFRSKAYYESSPWRATWKGEGGGVLLNQCPHNLDLLQWLFGMPTAIRGFCQFGRYHRIEVEDDVTAYLEMERGFHATFIASTGEAPGTNRLEIAADGGKIVLEDDVIKLTKNKMSASAFGRTTRELFAAPAAKTTLLRFRDQGGQHAAVLQNFVNAIAHGEPLIAPAHEGIKSVEIANGILLSSSLGKTVRLPLHAATYERWLRRQWAARPAAGDPPVAKPATPRRGRVSA